MFLWKGLLGAGRFQEKTVRSFYGCWLPDVPLCDAHTALGIVQSYRLVTQIAKHLLGLYLKLNKQQKTSVKYKEFCLFEDLKT